MINNSCNIIAIANRKGGCAKTTAAVNLAAALAEEGKKTLIIDMDSQANATTWLRNGLKDNQYSVFEFLAGRVGGKKIWYQDTVIELGKNLKLIPGSNKLNEIEPMMAVAEKTKNTEVRYYLQQRIREIDEDFDYILIDCPPGLGYIMLNVLTATDYAIIPGFDAFAVKGAIEVIDLIDTQIRKRNPGLHVLGFLITRYGNRFLGNGLPAFFRYRNLSIALKRYFNGNVLKTFIREDNKLEEACCNGQTIFEYKRYSNAGQDYEALAKEIISIIDALKQEDIHETERKSI